MERSKLGHCFSKVSKSLGQSNEQIKLASGWYIAESQQYQKPVWNCKGRYIPKKPENDSTHITQLHTGSSRADVMGVSSSLSTTWFTWASMHGHTSQNRGQSFHPRMFKQNALSTFQAAMWCNVHKTAGLLHLVPLVGPDSFHTFVHP